MKKIFIFSFIFIAFAACNNDKKSTPATIDTSSSSMAADALKNDAKAVPVDTSIVAAPVMATGDMTMKSGKMMVMKGGQWMEMKETLTTSNGIQVMSNGHIMLNNGTNMMMTEGGTIKINGDMLTKDGKPMTPATGG